ncbi:hypothetical protein BV350_02224 [Pseudomonas syringae pv. actinidiae]|nr:hypothetical protein BV350_02224 [Pseudomonas syringae pv. actinidiae]OSO11990.1 hypothetical protein BV357_02275 [Pseudomonas syringae pv. actinidiae]OSO17634.1 hypothetical protein BV358_02226 [Pseudomonas syringae pv. actinidiae]OSO25218.1 hypothetical protein BV361_02534 [Pseudomonas syringae pv. actinidiae]OSO63985.1 hypothetical protein BV366_02097 [Pseudomonas syringae pv. actinidiae]
MRGRRFGYLGDESCNITTLRLRRGGGLLQLKMPQPFVQAIGKLCE